MEQRAAKPLKTSGLRGGARAFTGSETPHRPVEISYKKSRFACQTPFPALGRGLGEFGTPLVSHSGVTTLPTKSGSSQPVDAGSSTSRILVLCLESSVREGRAWADRLSALTHDDVGTETGSIRQLVAQTLRLEPAMAIHEIEPARDDSAALIACLRRMNPGTPIVAVSDGYCREAEVLARTAGATLYAAWPEDAALLENLIRTCSVHEACSGTPPVLRRERAKA